jgi:hypothetical protein
MALRRIKNQQPLETELRLFPEALVALAEVRQYGSDWTRSAQVFVDHLYQDDPFILLQAAQTAAQDIGNESAEKSLAVLRRDFARWLLLKNCQNKAALQAQTCRLYEEAALVTHDPTFTLALAQAGLDLTLPRLQERGDTVLMAYLGQCYNVKQVEQLMATLPLEQHEPFLNARNQLGMTALHCLALIPDSTTKPYYIQGMLTTLCDYGARPDLAVKFDIGEGPVIGHLAHLAVATGQIELTAELMALDRGLFASVAHLNYTPLQVGRELADHQQLKLAAGGAWPLVVASFTAQASRGEPLRVSVAPQGSQFEHTSLRDLKAATNLAAFAIDKPLPYGDCAWVIDRLGPKTAPKARFMLQ